MYTSNSNSSYRVLLSIQSFDSNILDQSCRIIHSIATQNQVLISGPVSLPTKRRLFTVLRSPHIDKKSREQFQISKHMRFFTFQLKNPSGNLQRKTQDIFDINQLLASLYTQHPHIFFGLNFKVEFQINETLQIPMNT